MAFDSYDSILPDLNTEPVEKTEKFEKNKIISIAHTHTLMYLVGLNVIRYTLYCYTDSNRDWFFFIDKINSTNRKTF